MNKIIYLICSILLFGSCINKQKASQVAISEEEVTVEVDLSTIIHPNLLKEIRESIAQDYGRRTETIIIMVLFGAGKDRTELIISPSLSPYIFEMPANETSEPVSDNPVPMDGYLIIDNTMVVFYFSDEKWIKKDELITTPIPEEYLDEEAANTVFFDYPNKTFKVNNKGMTLELIRVGL